MRKGDTVFYSNSAGTFRARVETMHHDGSVTVTALFRQTDDGKDGPGYLGFKYRVDTSVLRQSSAAPEAKRASSLTPKMVAILEALDAADGKLMHYSDLRRASGCKLRSFGSVYERVERELMASREHERVHLTFRGMQALAAHRAAHQHQA